MYLVFHLATLAEFPFVHSDEVWLATLTRDMVQARSIAATESFFRLTPRFPHAFKVLFHLAQAPFIALSYSAAGARLLSLLAALMVLWFHRRTLGHVLDPLGRAAANGGRSGRGEWGRRARSGDLRQTAVSGTTVGAAPGHSAPGSTALLSAATVWTIVLALDAQFIYISHLARQEAAIMALTAGATWWVITREREWNALRTGALGLLLGAGVGIHPNAALVAAAMPTLVAALQGHRVGVGGALRHGALYAAGVVVGAGAFAAISVLLDGDFLLHYAAFGDAVGVGDRPARRIARFFGFWRKLLRRAAGTYYLPPVRVQLALFAAAFCATPVVVAVRHRRRRHSDALHDQREGELSSEGSTAAAATHDSPPLSTRVLAGAWGMALLLVAGLLALGKFSPPSVSLLWQPLYVVVALVVSGGAGPADTAPTDPPGTRCAVRPLRRLRGALLVPAAAAVAMAAITALAVTEPRGTIPAHGRPYGEYRRQIATAVPAGARVMTNLNAGFALDGRELYPYRDLAFLPERRSIVSYLRLERIEYVVFPSELERIYRERPLWNDLYGNVYPWYPALVDFLRREATAVARFETPYATRIVPYMDDGPHAITVYRLNPPPGR